LTLPVATHHQKTPINQIQLATHWPYWREKHLDSIRTNLGVAPYFKEVFPGIRSWLQSEYELLAELTISGIRLVADMLALSPNFFRTSEMSVSGAKTELLIDICRQLGATRYYSPLGSKEYIKENLFAKNGIELVYQNWRHPVYSQRGESFVSHLSVLDALMNVGPQATRGTVFAMSNLSIGL
jgi:hypothetical protein